ncbi:MAG: lysozyme inhibitor LprI family protein [Rhizobium sp.]
MLALFGSINRIGIAQTQAASFDCKLASNDGECSIRAAPFPMELDARLASSWQTARKMTRNPEALQADQRAWLKRRDEECGADVTCLLLLYRFRLPLLDPATVSGEFSWADDWYRSDQPDMVMHARLTGQDTFFIMIDMPQDRMHTESPAALVNGELSYANVFKGDDRECTKISRWIHRQVEVWNADLNCV